MNGSLQSLSPPPPIYSLLLFLTVFRKVHISQATLAALGNKFCVESADGQSRNDTLLNEKIETFFVTARNKVRSMQLDSRAKAIVAFHVFFTMIQGD